MSEIEEFRERWKEYFFWDEKSKILKKRDVIKSVIIGDTIAGDEIIFHPSNPNMIYVLPRHSNEIIVLGNNLASAINWIFSSGVLAEPIEGLFFESYVDRRRIILVKKEDCNNCKSNLNEMLSLKLARGAVKLEAETEEILKISLPEIEGYASITYCPPEDKINEIAIYCDKDIHDVEKIITHFIKKGFTKKIDNIIERRKR